MPAQHELSSAADPRRPRLPRVVWAVAWVSFFADLSTELVYGILPAFYLKTLSLSILSLAIIEGAAETVVSVARYFSGTLSDRTGRRPVWMGAGYALSGAAKPLMAFVSSGVAIGALRAADRLGKGIRGAPRDALVSRAVETERRGRAFGVQRALDHAGALAGGLIAGALLALAIATPTQLFLLAAIPGAASVLVIILFVRETGPGATPRSRDGLCLSPVRVWAGATPALRRYLLPASVFAMGNSSDILLLAVAWHRFVESGMAENAALARLPLLWALLHVIKASATAWAGSRSDRVDRVFMVRLAWLMYAGVYALAFVLGAGAPAWLAWPLFGAYGLYSIFAEAPEKALIADLCPDPDVRGSAYALVHCAAGVLTLPATLLGALLWMTAGPEWAFGAGALLALAGAALLSIVRPGPAPGAP